MMTQSTVMERWAYRQRAAMREVIRFAGRPLLAQEVLALAQDQLSSLDIATVYRNLKLLVEEGELRAVLLPGENPRYELLDNSHHHHFQCNQCQRVFDVHACPGNLSELAPTGFTVEADDLTLYGRCKDCQRPRRGVSHVTEIGATQIALTVISATTIQQEDTVSSSERSRDARLSPDDTNNVWILL